MPEFVGDGVSTFVLNLSRISIENGQVWEVAWLRQALEFVGTVPVNKGIGNNDAEVIAQSRLSVTQTSLG
jgi:hypothetical protein